MASRRNNDRKNKKDNHGYYGNNNNFDSRLSLNLNNADTITSSSSSSQNYNKNKKFIGGAERARQEARKRQWEPKNNNSHQEFGYDQYNNNKSHHHHHHHKKNKKEQNNVHDNHEDRVMNNILSNRKLRPSERFYAALLQPSNYHSSSGNNNRKVILQRICIGLGLGLPPSEYNTGGVIPHTDNIRTFFTSRAILVMEESRYTLTEALTKKNKDRRRNTSSSSSSTGTGTGTGTGTDGWMNVKLIDICEQKRTNFFVLEFENTTSVKRFTTTELSNQRPGCCYEIEILDNNNDKTDSSSSIIKLLGSVLPSGKRDASKLVLVVYDNEGTYQLQQMIGLAATAAAAGDQLQSQSQQQSDLEGASSSSSSSSSILQSISFRLRFCTTLISNCRQFEACDYGCSKKHKSDSSNSLLDKIMGQKESTHIRFNYSDDDDNDDNNESDNDKSDDDKSEDDKKDKSNNKDENESDDDDDDDDDSEEEEEDDEIIISHIDGGNTGNENSNPDNENSSIDDDNNSNSDSNLSKSLLRTKSQESKLQLQSKKLNPIQEKAAINFINSKDGSLKLIQGPPVSKTANFFVVELFSVLYCTVLY
jgi:hypothetical protein